MKILRLHIQNLNSLKGSHFLDFSETPFRGIGLFAITGDTGAGKTTILDAMTLALYGKTAREHEGEVMTYNTKESMSELEFEVKGKSYRAKWSRSLNRNNKWREPRFELVDLPDEKPLVRSLKTHVLPKIVQLTGLNYSQFLKSVLLAQGDFAAFLNSNKDQRSALLEKITGTEEYSRISKAAYDRFRIEKEQLTLLQSQSDYFNLLNEEEELVLRAELKEYQLNYNQTQTKINEIQSWLQWLNSITQLQEEQTQLQEHLRTIKEEQVAFAPTLKLLATHQKALPFEQDFILQKRLENQMDIDLKKINKLEEVISTHREELILSVAREEEVKVEYEKLASQKEDKEKLFDQVHELDIQIKNLQNPIREKESNIKKLKKDIQASENELNILKDQILHHTSKIQVIENWMGENDADQHIEAQLSEIILEAKELEHAQKSHEEISQQILQSRDQLIQKEKAFNELNAKEQSLSDKIEELRELFLSNLPQVSKDDFQQDIDQVHHHIQELRRDIQRYEQFVHQAEKLLSLEAQDQATWDHLDDANAALIDFKGQLEDFQQQLITAEEREKDKEKIYTQEQLIKKYEEDRAQLQQGDPCPLCLSTDHLCHEHQYIPKVSETKRDWNEAKKILKKIEKETATLQANITNQKGIIKNLNTQKEQLAIANAQALKELEDIDISMYKLFFSRGKQLEPIRGKIQTVSEVLQNFEEAYRSLSNIKNSRDKWLLEQSKLQADTSNTEVQVKNLKEQLVNFEQSQDQFQNALSEASTKLAGLLTPFQLSIEESFIAKLKKRKQNFQKGINKLAEHKQQLELNKSKSASVNESLLKSYQSLEETSNQLHELNEDWQALKSQRHDLFGERNLNTVRNRFRHQLKTAQQEYETVKDRKVAFEKQLGQKEQIQQLQREQFAVKKQEFKERDAFLEMKAVENDFENKKALEQAILSKRQATEIEEKQADLLKVLTQKKQSLSDNKTKIEQLVSQELTKSTVEDLTVQQVELSTFQKNNAEQIGSLKEKITQNERLKVKFAESQSEIEKQEKEFKRWDMLREMIGSADGKKFRVYAQSLTLRKLVSLANQHLKRLNDRYFIIKSEEDILELNILDRYQGNHARSMTTLSGGESFLVSLSLALGLSDLAGRNAQIQSLFIDEGFGTLDSKNLDLVLQALDNLQETGKTIGVISHVQELKERIHTQVQVMKIGDGVSKIRVVPTY